MPDKQDLAVGVLGAAAIAKKNVRAIGLARNGLRVVAVGSRSLAKSEQFLRDTGLDGRAKAYGSYDAVLEDPDVAAVYIPLPTSLHVEWVKKAAAAGKHVLCEKPISLTVCDAEAMLEACRAANVQWMDGTMLSHNPRLAKMEAAKPHLGELKTVTTLFCFCGPKEFLEGDIRVDKSLDGLGCLGDLGWYCIRMSLWAYDFTLPNMAVVHAGPVYNRSDVLMHVGATLLWSNGRRANLECGFDRAAVQFCEVGGTQGALALEDMCIPREEGSAQYIQRGSGFLTDLDTRIAQPREVVTVMLERPQDTLMWEEFARCIYNIRAGGAPTPQWSEWSLKTQRVVCAVEESARKGSPVQV